MIDTFELIVIDNSAKSKEEMFEKEMFYIQQYNSHIKNKKGYNMTFYILYYIYIHIYILYIIFSYSFILQASKSNRKMRNKKLYDQWYQRVYSRNSC